MKDTLQIDGYTVTIRNDEFAGNPLEDYGTEPPVLVFDDLRIMEYPQWAINPRYLLDLIPVERFNDLMFRGELVGIMGLETDRVSEWLPEDTTPEPEDYREAFASAYEEAYAPARYWCEAEAYFGLLETLCGFAGVGCWTGKRHGYVQGASILIFCAAIPAWSELVGAPRDSHERQCEGACNLYAAWAFGDCYEIESITDPDGLEIEDGSCCGYYGADHEESGLLERARDSIEGHKDYLVREAIASHDAACRDIVTV